MIDDGEYPNEEPFQPALTRKLIQGKDPEAPIRTITTEALVAAGEILRQFVQEACHRAGIEAECEHEGQAAGRMEDDAEDNKIPIRADHISKIAAELIMDFS